MTGTLAAESSGVSWPVPPSLDPLPATDEAEWRDQERFEPILCASEISAETRAKLSAVRSEHDPHNPKSSPSLRGLTFDSIARQHMVKPRMATRGALLAKPIVTKADALAGVDLIECLDGDAELVEATAQSLRMFLAVD
jgi:hypothetical protein